VLPDTLFRSLFLLTGMTTCGWRRCVGNGRYRDARICEARGQMGQSAEPVRFWRRRLRVLDIEAGNDADMRVGRVHDGLCGAGKIVHSVIWPISRLTLRPIIASIRATDSFTVSTSTCLLEGAGLVLPGFSSRPI